MNPSYENDPLQTLASLFVCKRNRTCDKVQKKLDKMLGNTAFKVRVVALAEGAKWKVELTYASFSKDNLSILVMHHGKSISLSFETDDDHSNLRSLTPFKVSKLFFNIKEPADWDFIVPDIKSKNASDLTALLETLTKLERVLNTAFSDTPHQKVTESTVRRDASAEQREAFGKAIQEKGIDKAMEELGGREGFRKFIDRTRQD